METKKVKLVTSKKDKDGKVSGTKERSFSESQALELLSMPSCRWKLSEKSAYIFNGKELVKK